MTDAEKPAADAAQPIPQAPAKAPEKVDISPLVVALAQSTPDLIDRFFGASEDGQKRAGYLLAWLVGCLTLLAGIAIFKGANDTAEKIVIALVSFLGGSILSSKSGGK